LHPIVGAKMAGMDIRHIVSSGLGAMASDANGVPFNGSWIVGTGNIAADMQANIHAEASGRVLATRLYELTDDPGMKDMLSFLIARDTMHQNQWMAVLDELEDVYPIPNSFPEEKQNEEFAYAFVSTSIDDAVAEGRWTSGPSIDGKGTFHVVKASPLGGEPVLPPARERSHAQIEQESA
jgi:Mn-containing catalase